MSSRGNPYRGPEGIQVRSVEEAWTDYVINSTGPRTGCGGDQFKGSRSCKVRGSKFLGQKKGGWDEMTWRELIDGGPLGWGGNF